MPNTNKKINKTEQECLHPEFNLFYGFQVYINPNSKKKYLLFKGLGSCCKTCNRVVEYNKDCWKYNKYGYAKLKTYEDMVRKYGKYPCYIVNENKQIIDFSVQYANEKEIRDFYGIPKPKVYQGYSKILPALDADVFDAYSAIDEFDDI